MRAAEGADIKVVSKIESADSIPNLQSILEASDGVSDVPWLPMPWS